MSNWSLIKDVCLKSFIEKKRKGSKCLCGGFRIIAEWSVCPCAGVSVTRRRADFMPVLKGNLWSRDD